MKTFDINSIQLNIQSLHFKIDEDLHNYLLTEIEKLGKTYYKIEKCDLVLKLEKSSIGNDCIVDAKLFVPGTTLYSLANSNDFKLAAKKVFEDMREQLLRHKDKTYHSTSL